MCGFHCTQHLPSYKRVCIATGLRESSYTTSVICLWLHMVNKTHTVSEEKLLRTLFHPTLAFLLVLTHWDDCKIVCQPFSSQWHLKVHKQLLLWFFKQHNWLLHSSSIKSWAPIWGRLRPARRGTKENHTEDNQNLNYPSMYSKIQDSCRPQTPTVEEGDCVHAIVDPTTVEPPSQYDKLQWAHASIIRFVNLIRYWKRSAHARRRDISII